MKRLILIVIFYSISYCVFADCADVGILVWPYSKTLKKNPIILLSAYSGGIKNEVLLGLNKKYQVYLKSGNQLVPLNIIEIDTGKFLLQILLKPATELKAGVEYELCIDSILKFKNKLWVGKWNFQKQRIDPTPKWIVIDEKDEIAPIWLSKPTEIGKHYWGGCPGASFVEFSCNFSDSSCVLVRLTVKNLITGKIYSYYSEPLLGFVRIGRFRCMTEFYFEKGTNYEARFTLMDTSGNYSKEVENTIQFFSPVPPAYQ